MEILTTRVHEPRVHIRMQKLHLELTSGLPSFPLKFWKTRMASSSPKARHEGWHVFLVVTSVLFVAAVVGDRSSCNLPVASSCVYSTYG